MLTVHNSTACSSRRGTPADQVDMHVAVKPHQNDAQAAKARQSVWQNPQMACQRNVLTVAACNLSQVVRRYLDRPERVEARTLSMTGPGEAGARKVSVIVVAEGGLWDVVH